MKTSLCTIAGLIVCSQLAASEQPQPPASPKPTADLPSRAEVYAKDVEFLLAELEKRAGHFFKRKGVDWPAVSAQFRQEAKAVKSDADHVRLCQRLVARLRDGHACLQDIKPTLPDEAQGRRWAGPSVHLLEQSGRVYLRQAFGPASEKGLRVGLEVSRIDGVPARTWVSQRVDKLRDDRGYSTDHQARYAACHWGLGDWQGTQLELEVIDGAEKKIVTLTRQGGANFIPVGPIFPPKHMRRVGRQAYGKTEGGFGYIHLRDTPGSLPDQLDVMLEGIGPAPGLVLDMRANGGGGCDHAAVFGRFVASGRTWRQYPSASPHPFAGPMIVIVDPGTRSAGETVSGMFKEDGRAYMIGEGPTAGTSSQKQTLAVPSGLFSAYFSVASNKGRFNQGLGIEGIGVPPHEEVPYDPAQLLRSVDTQIQRAEDLLRKGLPSDKVPFQP
jgi:C-terminal processing protease CtpA/Prc